jgi:hypothetical protein
LICPLFTQKLHINNHDNIVWDEMSILLIWISMLVILLALALDIIKIKDIVAEILQIFYQPLVTYCY